MAIVTLADLTDAAADAQTLEDVVNGAASPGTLTSRLGRSLSTVAKVIGDIQASLSTAVAAFMAALPSWAGAWSSATAYAVGQCVTYGGSSYVATQAGTNHLPTDTAYWTLIAQTGDVSQARTQNNTWTGANTFEGAVTLAAVTAPTWIGVTTGFSNTWALFTGFMRYSKDAQGIVRVQGSLYSGATPGGVLYTMPAGYRPTTPAGFTLPSGTLTGAAGVASIGVTSSGNIQWNPQTLVTPNTWYDFALTYPAF